MDIAMAFNPDSSVFDLQLVDGDLATDSGLMTAAILSLFTDRRALADDRLPDESNDRRGWWADVYNDRPFGSRLWLLSREKEQDEVLRRAREYCEEALGWMVEDGIAAAVEAEAEHLRRGTLLIRCAIIRGDGRAIERNFEYVWQSAA